MSCIYLSYYRKLYYLLSPEILDHISVYCYSHISHICIVVWWYVPCSHNKLMYAYNLRPTIQCLGNEIQIRAPCQSQFISAFNRRQALNILTWINFASVVANFAHCHNEYYWVLSRYRMIIYFYHVTPIYTVYHFIFLLLQVRQAEIPRLLYKHCI